MAERGKPILKRVAEYNPDVATGEILDPIANVDVCIFSVTFDARTGKKGPYILAIIEAGGLDAEGAPLDRSDAGVYHTGGAVVVERLAAMFGITTDQLRDDYLSRNAQPDGSAVFPVIGKFSKEKSASNPGQSYWTVG